MRRVWKRRRRARFVKWRSSCDLGARRCQHGVARHLDVEIFWTLGITQKQRRNLRRWALDGERCGGDGETDDVEQDD